MKRPWVDGNQVELLINGEAYYERVFQAMTQAGKRSCWRPSSSMTTRSANGFSKC